MPVRLSTSMYIEAPLVGSEPKRPTVGHVLVFLGGDDFITPDSLLYRHNLFNNIKFLKVVENLLNKISSKGIYDHLEGGIARYTVDEKWIVPHFEKMLYDNILYVNLLNNFLQKEKSNYL